MSKALKQYNQHFFNTRPVYALGQWFLDNFHPMVGYTLTRACAEFAYRFSHWQRRSLIGNVRHVLKYTHPEWSDDEVERRTRPMVHRIFINRGDWFADLSILAGKRPLATLMKFTPDGDFDRLGQHVKSGGGAILVSAHLGNWHAGSVVVGSRGVQVRSIMYGNHAAQFMYRGVERRAGVEPILVGDDTFSIVEIVRALRGGEVCAMLGDIPWDSRWVEMPFFGAPARFPLGAVRVARLAEVPIYPAFCVALKPGEFRAILRDPIEVKGPDPEVAEREALMKLIRIYEEIIPQYMHLWFNFSPIWNLNGNGKH